jgi:hypothetical protein
MRVLLSFAALAAMGAAEPGIFDPDDPPTHLRIKAENDEFPRIYRREEISGGGRHLQYKLLDAPAGGLQGRLVYDPTVLQDAEEEEEEVLQDPTLQEAGGRPAGQWWIFSRSGEPPEAEYVSDHSQILGEEVKWFKVDTEAGTVRVTEVTLKAEVFDAARALRLLPRATNPSGGTGAPPDSTRGNPQGREAQPAANNNNNATFPPITEVNLQRVQAAYPSPPLLILPAGTRPHLSHVNLLSPRPVRDGDDDEVDEEAQEELRRLRRLGIIM